MGRRVFSAEFQREAVAMVLFVCALPSGNAFELNVDDARISEHVNTALAEDARVVPSDIEVSTSDGIVTLTGTVGNVTARRYARLEAQKIEGVRGVIDALSIKPQDGSDNALARQAWQKLTDSAVAAPGSIRVRVHAGHVKLSGSVTSASAKRQAEVLAGSVNGAQSVTDGLQIHLLANRPDTAIENDVNGEITRDVYLEALPLTVNVRQCHVTLTGTVGSGYEKERAYNAAARVANVASIANDIQVIAARDKWWTEAGVRRQSPRPLDPEIVSAVEDTLWQDGRILVAVNIFVVANGGNVTIRGQVTSPDEKQVAGLDAEAVVGVRSVRNLIAVAESSDVRSGANFSGRIGEGVVAGARPHEDAPRRTSAP